MSSQDLRERLSAVGITHKDLAEKFSVSPSAVSNWLTRGKWSDEVEGFISGLESGRQMKDELLKELHRDGDAHIKPGNLVRSGKETFRVIRQDHCVTWKGGESWIYWISPAKQGKDGWTTNGQITRCPEGLLTDLGECVWVEKAENKAKLTDDGS